MNKINYDKKMEDEIKSIIRKGEKPKLLLHSCCAPCSSFCIEKLKDNFDITVYYYNPNMDSLDEFNLRAEEQIKFCKISGVKCIVENFDSSEFYSKIKGLEDEPERGKRCFVCYELRLNKTAEFAKINGFEYFTTTLTLSPLKNAEKLNEIGEKVASKVGVKFLNSDFKKNGGYLRSIELSKEYNLYRQNYCGCIYSKR